MDSTHLCSGLDLPIFDKIDAEFNMCMEETGSPPKYIIVTEQEYRELAYIMNFPGYNRLILCDLNITMNEVPILTTQFAEEYGILESDESEDDSDYSINNT